MYKSISDFGTQQPEQKVDQYEVVEIQNPQHKAQIIASNKIVVIDIYADWCGPCKQTAPTYAILASQFTNPGYCALVKYRFENMSTQERQNVHGIPIFEFYISGRKVDQIVGADLQAVDTKLRQILSEDNGNIVTDLRSQSSQAPQGPQYNRNTIRNSKSGMPSMEYDNNSPQVQSQQQYYPQAQGQQQYQPQQPVQQGANNQRYQQPYQPQNPYAQFSYSNSNGVNDDNYKS